MINNKSTKEENKRKLPQIVSSGEKRYIAHN
jgi:hypothetical protein